MVENCSRILRRAVEELGCSSATDSRQGLALAQSSRVSLTEEASTHLKMPAMDGMELSAAPASTIRRCR